MQAITIISMLLKSLKDEAVILLDLLPDNDKFASIKELRDEMYCFQGGLCQWVRHFLDKSRHHSVNVEGLNHLRRLLHDNQHTLSSGKLVIVIVTVVTVLS